MLDVVAPIVTIVPVIEEIDRSALSAKTATTSEFRLAADVNVTKD